MKNTMIVLLALLLPACVCAQQDVQTPKHILKTLDKQIQQQMTIALQRAATEELLAFLKTPQAKKTQILRKHVRRLVQEGANVNGQDKDGNRVFTLALRTGDADTVEYLVNQGIRFVNLACPAAGGDYLTALAKKSLCQEGQALPERLVYENDVELAKFFRSRKEAAARQSRRLGINYAIAPNCGIGFPITSDEGVYNFLDSMRTQPFVLAMQGEGREWSTTFSKEAREQFDYVFTDALTFTDRKGRRVRLWIAPEVVIDNNDQEAYMDLIVEKTCDVLQEPADIFVNPFFLPECMNDRYEQFWTDARVDKVIRELVKNGKALEINELYRIPSQRIIMKAKEAGVKFTFGSNNVSPEVGKLEYALQMKKACGITAEEMYVPRIK